MGYYIALFLLIAILVKELLYFRDLKVSTNKSLLEVICILIASVVIVLFTVILGKKVAYYTLGCVGLGLLMVDWLKQGISNKGILIVARGKELYKWNQIEKVKIYISDKIKIEYFNKSNSKIISQNYAMIGYDKILREFKSNGVDYEIIHSKK